MQEELDYRHIERAIHFIGEQRNTQPSLEEIAAHINMSPYHFQRLFTRWAGISPKKFLQFLTLQYAKEQLRQNFSLSQIAFEAGLSGTSRLYDLFVKLEGITPGQYKRSGKGITIYYGFHQGPFGKFILAITSGGQICALEFTEEEEEAVRTLHRQWSESELRFDLAYTAPLAKRLFSNKPLKAFRLLVKGTPFQLKVWEALLKIPFGKLVSYQAVSEHIHNPGGIQATGGAIAKNPIAFLIPCHRVVRKTGEIHAYRWGVDRKSALIGWEAAHKEQH
ncbi:MAG: methylated-DNA--[protein]-cysteine S-methyltransferase [Bacteroidales bacterium]|nr:methylated-DNA--[protein]-cysteine S-methyltransferase [Bacteroidales bacterium]